MPRPVKRRRVCGVPKNNKFGPITGDNQGSGLLLSESIYMTVDEYETIRLIDGEGKTQEECAVQMNVSRTTVQGIYIDARKKLADLIVNGKTIIVEGGNYKLCTDEESFSEVKPCCGCKGQGRGRKGGIKL